MSSPGPSISERGINSPARSVVSDHLPITFSAPAVPLAAPQRQPTQQIQQMQPAPQMQQKPKTIVFSSPTITTTNTKPRYVVEKVPAAAPVITASSIRIAQPQQAKKEVKIYKMTPTSQHVMNAVNGLSGQKKVTIQMKDAQGKLSQHPAGTYVINKNTGNISGNFVL